MMRHPQVQSLCHPPGLVTEGKDLEHARTMSKDAVRCQVEGFLENAKEPIPRVRETAQVKISAVA